MKTIGTKKHYKNNNDNGKASMTLEPPSLLSEEKMMVYQYFTLLGNGKVDAILDMFIEEEDMAIVYEPFSKEQGLHGKDAIKNFLQVAAIANRGVEKTIEIIQPEVKKVAKAKGEECSTITITAVVTFIRGGSVKGRFEFDFVTEVDSSNRIIILVNPCRIMQL